MTRNPAGRVAAGLVLAASLTLAALGASSATVSTAAGAADLNHAAIVVDTGDGEVRRYCLAFPEESISGAEALRRVDVDPVFSSYGSKGEAVCSLCGVGCPAGDCFCDAKYWSYHRAGPGGEDYTTSRVGASSTEVRDGDVEGWRWGGGQAPPRATVGQVCDVPEPPARTAAGSSSTTAPPPTTTTAAPSEDRAAPKPASAPTTSSSPPPSGPSVAPPPAGAGGPAPVTERSAPTEPVPAPEDVAGVDAAAEAGDSHDADDADTAGDRSTDELSSAAPTAATRDQPDGGGGLGGPASVVAFVTLLAVVLGWRSRLRRANVRP